MLGVYLNPDEIEKEVSQRGYFDIRGLDLSLTQDEVIDFFDAHPLLQRTQEVDYISAIRLIQNEFIDFAKVGFNAYLSAILTDFLR